MKYIFRKDLYLKDMGCEDNTWSIECDGKEVLFDGTDIGWCNGYTIHEDWCEVIE